MDNQQEPVTVGGSAEPEIDYQIFVAGNFNVVCEKLAQWVNSTGLKREQLISISANETQIDTGDSVLVLIYRRQQEPSMTSLENLKYHVISGIIDWDEQFKEIQRKAISKCEIVALTHTARNIGQINVQVLWYLETRSSFNYTCKHIQNNGDIVPALQEAKTYLNTFVAPHNLVSFSVFEDDHPCPQKHYHVVIVHKGQNEKPFKRNDDIQGDVYELTTLYSQNSWEQLISHACAQVESKGVNETKSAFATYNFSEDDQQGVAVLSWSKAYEDTLADLSRGGCCTIF